MALLTTVRDTLRDFRDAKLIFERRDGMAFLSAVEWPGESVQVMSPFMHVAKGAVAAALR